MMRQVQLLLIVVALATSIATPGAAADAVASYTIDVSLDVTTHSLTAREEIEWVNTTSAPATELRFHLYLNGFANPDTTFMQGWGRARWWPDGGWGWIRWTELALADGRDLLAGLELVQPDDGNPSDATVVRVPLPEPLGPGETIRLVGRFAAQLPEIIARTGYVDDFYLVGQWFPKLGVFAGEDGWHCHQFHAATEFYADFGRYRVTVDVPRDWRVLATGVELSRSVQGERQQVVLAAERVEDFVWATAPAAALEVVETSFEPQRDVPVAWLEEAADLLGVSTAELELPPIAIRLAVPPEQRLLVPRMERAARLSIAWSGLRLGPYPYPQLTIVSPPAAAEEAGGMEYPTFITTGADPLEIVPPLSLGGWAEGVVAHEFGHQYVPCLVATDESEQAWIDEGLASWLELKIMTAMAASGGPVTVDRFIDRASLYRLWAGVHGRRLVVDQPARAFRTMGEFYRASYGDAYLGLASLEGLIGEAAFTRGLRGFVARHRFGHAGGDDLERAMADAAGTDLGWFFRQTFGTGAVADWAVLAVEPPLEPPSDAGYRWRGGAWIAAADLAPQEGPAAIASGWTIDLGRLGDLVGPVTVAVEYADGSSERRSWDGVARWARWQLEPGREPTMVTIDPDLVWRLETRRADNTWRAAPARGPARRQLWWLYGLLHLVLGATG